MREKDEKIPLKHGLVGQETCGLGGFAYGMRSIKGLLEIVDHIQDYAPKAWILNYTNPESIVSEAVRRKYPNVKMINACDMTISIEETIAVNYGYDRKNWIVTYYGLNHFGWYTSIYDKELQREIMPEIIEKLITKEMQVADFNIGDKTWQKTFQMMSVITKNFPSNIPNNYLEYYLYPDMVVEHTDKEYTRANMVMDGREKNTKEMADKMNIEGEEVTLLQHIILSHHGKNEFGSPILPQIKEAEVIYLIDNMDARINMLDKALETVEPGGFSKRVFALENRAFYKPKMN